MPFLTLPLALPSAIQIGPSEDFKQKNSSLALSLILNTWGHWHNRTQDTYYRCYERDGVLTCASECEQVKTSLSLFSPFRVSHLFVASVQRDRNSLLDRLALEGPTTNATTKISATSSGKNSFSFLTCAIIFCSSLYLLLDVSALIVALQCEYYLDSIFPKGPLLLLHEPNL